MLRASRVECRPLGGRSLLSSIQTPNQGIINWFSCQGTHCAVFILVTTTVAIPIFYFDAIRHDSSPRGHFYTFIYRSKPNGLAEPKHLAEHRTSHSIWLSQGVPNLTIHYSFYCITSSWHIRPFDDTWHRSVLSLFASHVNFIYRSLIWSTPFPTIFISNQLPWTFRI